MPKLPSLLTILLLFSCNIEKKVILGDLSVYQNPNTTITVRLGIDASGIRDYSFNAMAWRGVTRFYGDTPEYTSKRSQLYDYFLNKNQEQHLGNLRAVAEHGYDLIILTGSDWAPALNQIAGEFPQQKFMAVDSAGLPNSSSNIMQIIYADEQGAFLAGLAAALKAKELGLTPRFGFIGGVAGPVITRFEAGYKQGVLTIFPDTQILSYYTGSWINPEKAKAQANLWYEQGVYAIFSAAGFTGSGTLDEAKRRRRRGEDVWAIGVDSDQYEEGLYSEGRSAILTSMIKRIDAIVQFTLWTIDTGKFKAIRLKLDLGNGGVGLPELNPNLSAALMQEIEIYKKKVIEGEIIVADTLDKLSLLGNAAHSKGF